MNPKLNYVAILYERKKIIPMQPPPDDVHRLYYRYGENVTDRPQVVLRLNHDSYPWDIETIIYPLYNDNKAFINYILIPGKLPNFIVAEYRDNIHIYIIGDPENTNSWNTATAPDVVHKILKYYDLPAGTNFEWVKQYAVTPSLYNTRQLEAYGLFCLSLFNITVNPGAINPQDLNISELYNLL